jgi:hypothetical protein
VHNKDLRALYPASCYYYVQIKDSEMVGHVTCVRGIRTLFWSEIVNELDLLGDDVDVGLEDI